MRGVPLAEVDPPDPALQVVHGLQRLGQGDVAADLAPRPPLPGRPGQGVAALARELVAPARVQLHGPAAGREVEPVLPDGQHAPQRGQAHHGLALAGRADEPAQVHVELAQAPRLRPLPPLAVGVPAAGQPARGDPRLPGHDARHAHVERGLAQRAPLADGHVGREPLELEAPEVPGQGVDAQRPLQHRGVVVPHALQAQERHLAAHDAVRRVAQVHVVGHDVRQPHEGDGVGRPQPAHGLLPGPLALAGPEVPLHHGGAVPLQLGPALLARHQRLLPEGVAGQAAAGEEAAHRRLGGQQLLLHGHAGRDHVRAVLHEGQREEAGVGRAEPLPGPVGEKPVHPPVERHPHREGGEAHRLGVEPQQQA